MLRRAWHFSGSSTIALLVAALSLIAPALAAPTTQSADPKLIHAGELWLDTNGKHISAHGGSMLFHDGAYYWFGEYHTPVKEDRSFKVYRSTDLANWQNMGDALKVVSEPGNPLEAGSVLERPRVLFNKHTGKFVMYFHHELSGRGYGAAHAAVAIADQPQGPYQLVRSERVNKGYWPMNWHPTSQPSEPAANLPPGMEVHTFDAGDEKYKRLVGGFSTGQDSRDMTVSQDDDGHAYLISSSEMNGTLHLAELTDDYLNTTGRFIRLMEGRSREAPALFRVGSKYYLITSGCTGWKSNAADVAVAPSVWGPWKSLGNPWQGPPEQTKISFDSQSTWVFKLPNGTPVLMADRWNAKSLDTSGYIWMPIDTSHDKPTIHWTSPWDITALSR